jgi:hypothetical protein
MRQMIFGQMISGMVAALAVVAAGVAPAKACGFTPCQQTYVPTTSYSDCATGCGIGGWGFERLAEPTTQYYYVNQGPTYTGPGAFAPYPTYQDSAVSSYRWHRPHPRFIPRYAYVPRVHRAMRYGYAPHGYYYGHPVLRRYY